MRASVASSHGTRNTVLRTSSRAVSLVPLSQRCDGTTTAHLTPAGIKAKTPGRGSANAAARGRPTRRHRVAALPPPGHERPRDTGVFEAADGAPSTRPASSSSAQRGKRWGTKAGAPPPANPGPSSRPCPQEREAARPTTATVPDASRRPEPPRYLSRHGQVLAPPTGPGLLPLPEVESSGSRQSCGPRPIGLAARSTERGTLEYDCPLRLPRSPQGRYPQPRRGPASSQSTEVGARTAGW